MTEDRSNKLADVTSSRFSDAGLKKLVQRYKKSMYIDNYVEKYCMYIHDLYTVINQNMFSLSFVLFN